ncbi:MAG: C4-type zinc ribbon domain-containing protein [Candidatus Omnitrophica bacterium]|nr:C4-type zinc ribbon domain-containing protein [Candidatus Omnitrophota bacterium]
MDLKIELAKLVHLQELDLEIYRLKDEKENNIPTQLKQLQSQLENEKQKLVSFEQNLKDLQVKRKNKEIDLATKEETIKKAQVQLYQLKTNKEYQAKLAEIASIKADVSVLEEEVLKILDEIEKAEKKYADEKEKFLNEEKKIKEEQDRLNARINQINSKILQLNEQRSIKIKEINPNILAKYEKLLNTRQGIAMAAVDIENENCKVCNMRVTAQQINEIKMYKELVFCENCVRILYIPEDVVI